MLVLTKPLGTGIVTTGIKRGLTSAPLARKAIKVMAQLNTVGADLAEKGLVRAAVDVTGFGLLGHLVSMCRASGVGAMIDANRLPVLNNEVLTLIARDCIPGGSRDNLAFAAKFVEWDNVSDAAKTLLTDAQTSGGLLLCVPPKRLTQVLQILDRHRTPANAVIGAIVGWSKPKIHVSGSR